MDIYEEATEQRLEQLYDDIGVLEYHLTKTRNKKAKNALNKLSDILHETVKELEK